MAFGAFRAAFFAMLTILATGFGFSAWAQSYPSKPITIMVPYPPGGPADTFARLVADRLSAFGQPVVVENRGGGIMIGSMAVSRSAPDGHTLLLANSGGFSLQPLVNPNVTYDPVKDFTALGMVGEVFVMVGVNNEVPANTVAEFVELAKRNPGKLNYGSTGTGSAGNFAGEMLRIMAGVDVVHVPYRGSSQALADLLGNRIQIMFDQILLPQSKAGKVKLLATTASRRFPELPDLPTMKEAGYPDFDVSGWFGLFGPPGMPAEVINRINDTLNKAVADPEYLSKMQAMALIPKVVSAADFAKLVKDDLVRYADIKRRANIQNVE